MFFDKLAKSIMSKSIMALAIGCQIALGTQALADTNSWAYPQESEDINAWAYPQESDADINAWAYPQESDADINAWAYPQKTAPNSRGYLHRAYLQKANTDDWPDDLPRADYPEPESPDGLQDLPPSGVELDQYVWDNDKQRWSSTTNGGLQSTPYTYYSNKRENYPDPQWVTEVPNDSRYKRSYTHYASGYSGGEENHPHPGDRDLLGHFVTNMITMDYAMEHGWYQDSVSKVLDPETGEVLNHYISPKVMEKYFRAGTPYVNQNWGLAYILFECKNNKCGAYKKNGTYYANYDLVFDKINNTAPIIFAKYDPVTKSGVINIQRVETVNNGDLLIVQKRFTPEDGGPSSCTPNDALPHIGCRWAGWTDQTDERTDHYDIANVFGYNPLLDFYDSDRPDQFTSITADAFYAIVGALVINQGAGVAYVANMMTRDETLKEKHGNLFRKKVTYTVNTYTHPFWTTITPPSLPIPNAYHTGFKTSQGDTFTLGYGAFVRHQGQHATLPNGETLTYTYSETHSSWTFLAMVFLVVAIGFVFPYAAAALGLGNIGVGSLVIEGGVELTTNALLTGLATGLTNAAWNIAQGYNSPADAVDRMFGTGKDPLDIDELDDGFDWRKEVQAVVIGSDPGQDILKSVGATGEWFQSQSLEHKEKFASGFDLAPGSKVEYSSKSIQEMTDEFESWMANF